MDKTLVIGLLVLATLGSLGWGVHEHREVKRLRGAQVQAAAERARSEATEVSQLRQELARQKQTAESVQKQYEKTISRLNTQLTSKRVETAANRIMAEAGRTSGSTALEAIKEKIGKMNNLAGGAAPGTESDKTKAAKNKPLLANLGKMMKNPEMRKMIQAQQKPILEMTYAPLYDLLNLPEDQRNAFKGLLEKKQTEAVNIGLEMLDDSLTPEQKKANQQRVVELTKQVDKEIETLLGKENYNVYKTYEETQPERMSVQTFNRGLDEGQQLTEMQQNDLVFAMHKARSEFKFTTTDLEKQDRMPDFSKLTPEVMNKHMEEIRQLNAKYVELATPLMNPAQLERFKASLEQQQQMQEFGIKLLMGDPKEK